MKLVRILFLFIALMLFASSCSHTNEQLLRAEQLVENAPDSAMTILNKYSYNKLSDKDKALYGLVYIWGRDKKHLSLEPDTFLNYAIGYYAKNPDEERLATCYLFKGRRCFYQQNFEKAMENYLRSLDAGLQQPVLKAKMYTDMGLIFTIQKDFILARSKYKLSYDEYMKANKLRPALNALIDIGRTYCYESKYDSSAYYFNMVLQRQTDSIVAGNVLMELGISYYQQQKYDSALYYLYQSIGYPYIKNNQAIRLYNIADINFDLSKYSLARKYALKAIETNADVQTKLGCYRILANCASMVNNKKEINYYIVKYQQCDDSIRKINAQTKGSYIETMHNTQKEVVKSRSWIWYLTLLLIIFAAGGIYLYVRKHKKSQKVIQQSKAEHSREKTEIRKDIMLKKRKVLFANIDRIKEEQKKPENRTLNFTLRIKNMYNELLHIQETALFFCEMDGVLNNIVTKLKEVLPDISDKELTYCCLHLLKIPTHDILILLDYESVNSLKGMKRRLAQKLGLDNASRLNDYLLSRLSGD